MPFYLWNSGMLLFKASAMISELEIFAPEILEAARKAVAGSIDDLDFCRLSSEALESCPSMSIDYAVMEHTTRGAIVPLDAGWNDIGSWEAVWDVSEKDAQGNACKGNVYLQDTGNSLVLSEKRLVTMIGVKNLVVVETRDSILITDRVHSEKVKGLVEDLNSMGHEEVHDHRQVHRPWGWYDSIDEGSRFKAKRIMVKPGEKLSLQKHHHRAEHWVVVKGTAVVECDDQTLMLGENESTFIPLGAVHRLSNPGQIPLEIIEVQSGSYLGEDDIVRLQDDYGRTENIDAYKESLLNTVTYVCYSSNEFCGFVRAVYDKGQAVYVSELYVVKKWRNENIGQVLLEQVRTDYSNLKMYALSDEDSYYQKKGYKRIGSVFEIS